MRDDAKRRTQARRRARQTKMAFQDASFDCHTQILDAFQLRATVDALRAHRAALDPIQ
jgi:hypothetical protein